MSVAARKFNKDLFRFQSNTITYSHTSTFDDGRTIPLLINTIVNYRNLTGNTITNLNEQGLPISHNYGETLSYIRIGSSPGFNITSSNFNSTWRILNSTRIIGEILYNFINGKGFNNNTNPSLTFSGKASRTFGSFGDSRSVQFVVPTTREYSYFSHIHLGTGTFNTKSGTVSRVSTFPYNGPLCNFNIPSFTITSFYATINGVVTGSTSIQPSFFRLVRTTPFAIGDYLSFSFTFTNFPTNVPFSLVRNFEGTFPPNTTGSSIVYNTIIKNSLDNTVLQNLTDSTNSVLNFNSVNVSTIEIEFRITITAIVASPTQYVLQLSQFDLLFGQTPQVIGDNSNLYNYSRNSYIKRDLDNKIWKLIPQIGNLTTNIRKTFFDSNSPFWELANDGGYGASDTPPSAPGTFKYNGVENAWQCEFPYDFLGNIKNDFLPTSNLSIIDAAQNNNFFNNTFSTVSYRSNPNLALSNNVISDGKSIFFNSTLDFAGPNYFPSIRNFVFKNCNFQTVYTANFFHGQFYVNCLFLSSTHSSSKTRLLLYILNSILKNFTDNTNPIVGFQGFSFNRSIIENSNIKNINNIGSEISFPGVGAGLSGDFRSSYIANSTFAVRTDQTSVVNFLNCNQINNTLSPLITFTNSISTAALFNNPILNDYTISRLSLNFRNGNNNENIGNGELGLPIYSVSNGNEISTWNPIITNGVSNDSPLFNIPLELNSKITISKFNYIGYDELIINLTSLNLTTEKFSYGTSHNAPSDIENLTGRVGFFVKPFFLDSSLTIDTFYSNPAFNGYLFVESDSEVYLELNGNSIIGTQWLKSNGAVGEMQTNGITTDGLVPLFNFEIYGFQYKLYYPNHAVTTPHAFKGITAVAWQNYISKIDIYDRFRKISGTSTGTYPNTNTLLLPGNLQALNISSPGENGNLILSASQNNINFFQNLNSINRRYGWSKRYTLSGNFLAGYNIRSVPSTDPNVKSNQFINFSNLTLDI